MGPISQTDSEGTPWEASLPAPPFLAFPDHFSKLDDGEPGPQPPTMARARSAGSAALDPLAKDPSFVNSGPEGPSISAKPGQKARMASLTADDEASSHVSLNPGSAPAAGAAEDGQRAAAPRPAPGAIRLQRPRLAADHVMHINPEFSEEAAAAYELDADTTALRDDAAQESSSSHSAALLGGDPGTPQSRGGHDAGPMSPGSSVALAHDAQRSTLLRSGIGRGIKTHTDGKSSGPSDAQGATAELSALMQRARELIGMQEHSRRADLSAGFDSTSPTTARNTLLPDTLHPVQEDTELDEETLLARHLEGAQGSLASAYEALNRKHETSSFSRGLNTYKLPSCETLSEFGSGGGCKKSSDSFSKKGSDVSSVGMSPHGAAGMRLRPSRLLTQSEYEKQRESEMRAKKSVRISLFPMLLYLAFIAAAVIYCYTRVMHGMDGLRLELKIYSYIVLVIEVMGIVNMLFYGCWLFAKPDNADVFPRDEKIVLPELRRAYNVRVLIPCYKESLAIIQRTVLAAKRADRPPGTKLYIYVCDDGNDPKKLAWVQQAADPEIMYVTGRDKSLKSLNGKSANLNYCLQLLYPDVLDPERPDEFMKIPVNELMCLFDADQTCSKGFFQVLLRYIDSGDDVGVALSPQLMYNVIPDCDVFNHQNVHFWEMMQPGMDALGFISLTGTNMILRCRALREAGWFPMNSVTEDWALGMRFKKLGYRCRYVNQYLAIGEAPDITQQAFQQRSRWSKGHFQVFWSGECPLFDGRLNLFYRLAYSSTCISYLSTGLSVIVLNLVPVLTILFGYFPIALNIYTVVGITAYYGALNALSYYCLSWSHYKALWLANTSSVILFYPYLKASFLTPVKQLLGKTMEFKTTLKGAAPRAQSFKVIGPALLISLINIATFFTGIVTFNVSVNAAQAISLCWIVFNTVPHLTLLFNSAFGPGGFMVAWCRFGMFVTAVAGTLAVILMWLLYPREVSFFEGLQGSVTYLQAEVSGEIPRWFPHSVRSWRSDSGLQYERTVIDALDGVTSVIDTERSIPPFNATVDLSGGFYENGIYGPVKLTKTIAMATSLLAWSILDVPEVMVRQDVKLRETSLSMLQHGVDYIRNCVIKDPANVGDVEGDVYIYQVGDLETEMNQWRRPEDVTAPWRRLRCPWATLRAKGPKLPPARINVMPSGVERVQERQRVRYVAGLSSPTDLTGQMTAALVSGTMALHQNGRYQGQDKQVAENLAVAERLYNVTLKVDGVLEHDRELWRDDSFYDDRMWAASWMFRAGNNKYYNAALTQRAIYQMQRSWQLATAEHDTNIVNQHYFLNAAIVHSAILASNADFHAAAQSFVWDWICSGGVEYTTFGRAFLDTAPLLGDTTLAAALAQIYALKATTENDLVPASFRAGFKCFAQQQARYLIGEGWRRKSYIVGINDKGYNRLVHRGASCPAWPARCPPDMAASKAPDANVLVGGLLWLPHFDDAPKNTRGGNVTAVSLGNNMALPLLMAGMEGRADSWLECLQSTGALLSHRVCRQKRPISDDEKGAKDRKRFHGRYFDTPAAEQAGAGEVGRIKFPLTRSTGKVPNFNLNPALWKDVPGMPSLLGVGWKFYEAQRSGRLPPSNKIPWRGDSYGGDGSDAVPPMNLEGGWYDAGDSLKLTLPFATSVWRLGWSLLSHKAAYQGTRFENATNYQNGLRQLVWAAQYLERLHPNATAPELVVQVGNVTIDHRLRASDPLVPEQRSDGTTPRPVWIVNNQKPGSDVIAEVVSAFAACSLVLKDLNPDMSARFIKHSRFLYDWMNSPAQQGTLYWQSQPGVTPLYKTKLAPAHMMLAAAWMHKLVSEKQYADEAAAFHGNARKLQREPIVDWSNPLQEAKLLLLEEQNPQAENWAQYLETLRDWVNWQMTGENAEYTPKGLWFDRPEAQAGAAPVQGADAQGWGRLKNAALGAHVAMRTAAIVDEYAVGGADEWQIAWAHRARCWALSQMQYITGTGLINAGRSFVTGWGKNPPRRPHHRGAACRWVRGQPACSGADFLNPNLEFPNTLPGGLVSGPTDLDEFADDHTNYQASEVACDYNAALVSGTSGLMMLPAHFWQHTNFCPSAEDSGRRFPTEAVPDWEVIEVRAVPGVRTAASTDAAVSESETLA